MGLAILAGGLAFVGSADATELIGDGSFENTAATSSPIVKSGGTANPGVNGGWSPFSTYLYSTLYTLPGPAGSGAQFLRPYAPDNTTSKSSQTVTQLVSLTATTTLTPAKIDGGQGRFTMSAWFSSYLVQGDYSDLTLQFLDDSRNVVGSPIALGGMEFVANIPTGENAKYGNAKDWAQDLQEGPIPTGARTALVKIVSTSVGGLPDGYVDLVSLDVADTGVASPTLASASPADNAIGVGPVVDLIVRLQDRATAVNTNSIKLFLDNNLVIPSIQKPDTNTVVQYSAGLLPALSPHTYSIVFGDTGTPARSQTNQFHFTVADYLTLPTALRTPLGSEDTTKPGFDVMVYQVEASTDPNGATRNLPSNIEFSEAVLAGLVGPNIADLSGAAASNNFAVTGVINWVISNGATANFPNDGSFPGIPGTTGSEDNFVDDIRTFVRFPASGFYQMGVNNEDQFRLSAATAGVLALQLGSGEVIPAVALATNVTSILFGGALPLTPLTAPVVYATPSGNPDDACLIATHGNLAGKIALLDRGGTNCDSAFKAEQAQLAGAVAVIEITPGDPGFPFRLGDINPNVHIPVLMVSEGYGGDLIKSNLNKGLTVTATIRGDPNPRLAEWNGPKGFGAVDVLVGFGVPAPGIYPLRLVAGQGGGAANLEWFSIKPDGTRILVNDTANPDALLAFRARTAGGTSSVMNLPTLQGTAVTLSWTGAGTLEEASSVLGPWNPSPSQNNPQTVQASASMKFYRIRRP